MNLRELRLIRIAVLLGALAGCIGCGDNTPAEPSDPCEVKPGDVIGYQQCTPDLSCVASCGVLPADWSPGHLLAPGCHVKIGTSSIVDATCVASCGECPGGLVMGGAK